MYYSSRSPGRSVQNSSRMRSQCSKVTFVRGFDFESFFIAFFDSFSPLLGPVLGASPERVTFPLDSTRGVPDCEPGTSSEGTGGPPASEGGVSWSGYQNAFFFMHVIELYTSVTGSAPTSGCRTRMLPFL